jgi:hypothetical protein
MSEELMSAPLPLAVPIGRQCSARFMHHAQSTRTIPFQRLRADPEVLRRAGWSAQAGGVKARCSLTSGLWKGASDLDAAARTSSSLGISSPGRTTHTTATRSPSVRSGSGTAAQSAIALWL